MAVALDTNVETKDWRKTSLVRTLHSLNARLLAVFILFHLYNHTQYFFGVERHLATMDSMRAIYRLPFIEYPLYVLFFLQITFGLILAKKNWKPQSAWSWVQVISGLVIAFFLLQHLAATIFVRNFVPYVDTDAWWALSVVSQVPLNLYFAPYYFTGILAVFFHLAAALHFHEGARGFAIPVATVGVIMAPLIVGSMLLAVNSVELPAEYQRYLSESYGL